MSLYYTSSQILSSLLQNNVFLDSEIAQVPKMFPRARQGMRKLKSQNCHCWWQDGSRSQCISSYDIDVIVPEYTSVDLINVNLHGYFCT